MSFEPPKLSEGMRYLNEALRDRAIYASSLSDYTNIQGIAFGVMMTMTSSAGPDYAHLREIHELASELAVHAARHSY
jgi:hypothetical protein